VRPRRAAATESSARGRGNAVGLTSVFHRRLISSLSNGPGILRGFRGEIEEDFRRTD